MSSGHDRYMAVMSSQQLCVLARALHGITDVTIVAWMGEGLTSPRLYRGDFLPLMVSGGGQWMAQDLWVYGQHKWT